MNDPSPLPMKGRGRWYDGITAYQWLVLVIASLGWIFDVFEGQVFVSSMNEAMPSLLPPETTGGEIALYNNIAMGAFLAGGALGGVGFGVLADRIGRIRTLTITILVYSLFTFVTALSQAWWHIVVLRFFVALGVGGEWAVASALVAEVFPRQARAWSGSIFHGSSVLGTYLAVAVGTWVVANPALGWRAGFALGVLPALLTVWIRATLREPDTWRQSQHDAVKRKPVLAETCQLFAPRLWSRTTLALLLAFVGLATFWGVHIYGKDVLLRRAQAKVLSEAEIGASADEDAKRAALGAHAPQLKRVEMLAMFLVTTGGGAGLVAFGPICERLGRRAAFALYHLGALAVTLLVFQFGTRLSDSWLTAVLPLFGFLTLGMHAGYAIYFPELFPTSLRSTGAGFCFNFARLAAALVLVINGWLQKSGMSLENAATVLGFLYLAGVGIVALAPETKGTELPQ
jgi:MFS family permease